MDETIETIHYRIEIKNKKGWRTWRSFNNMDDAKSAFYRTEWKKVKPRLRMIETVQTFFTLTN